MGLYPLHFPDVSLYNNFMEKTLQLIETAYENPQAPITEELRNAIENTLKQIGDGTLRVAQKDAANWQVNQAAKKAILLSFRARSNRLIDGGWVKFYDKLDTKFSNYSEDDFQQLGARAVPGAIVREGAYIAPNVVLMPCYVNIGAYVDSGTLVDTWATVGSCAQIGKNVHLSGGVGIGGVLEPLQASPTIIEDNCFIGARSEVVEGVLVEEGAVLSMGVYIGMSTPIYDRSKDEVFYGRVPSGSVVIPGSLPAANGKYSRYAAIIVKQADAKTRAKVGINQLLRFDETDNQ